MHTYTHTTHNSVSVLQKFCKLILEQDKPVSGGNQLRTSVLEVDCHLTLPANVSRHIQHQYLI